MRVQQPKGHHRTYNKGRELWRKTSPIVPNKVKKPKAIVAPSKSWAGLDEQGFRAWQKARFPDA